jgi:hypothetical protein
MQHTRLSQSCLGHGCRQLRQTPAPLSKEPIKCMQDIFGALLYYRRAVDPTILPAISAVMSRQAQGTEALADACHQLLDYIFTHPNAGIHYLASNMILAVHTDASYLSKHTRAVGHQCTSTSPKRRQRIQQRRHSKPCQHHQTCYVLGIRG